MNKPLSATDSLATFRCMLRFRTSAEAAPELGVAPSTIRKRVNQLGLKLASGRPGTSPRAVTLKTLNPPGFLRELELRLVTEAELEKAQADSAEAQDRLSAQCTGAGYRLAAFEHYQIHRSLKKLRRIAGEFDFTGWLIGAGINLPSDSSSQTLEDLNDSRHVNEFHRRLQAEAKAEHYLLRNGLIAFKDSRSTQPVAPGRELTPPRRGIRLDPRTLTPGFLLGCVQGYVKGWPLRKIAREMGVSPDVLRRRLRRLGIVPVPQNANHAGFLRELELRLRAEIQYEECTNQHRPPTELSRFLGASGRLRIFELYQKLQSLAALERILGQGRKEFLPWMLGLGLNLCHHPSDTFEGLNDQKFLRELHRRLQMEAKLEEIFRSSNQW